MSNIMKPSENAYALLRKVEGLSLKVYKDSDGVGAIGYGHHGVPLDTPPITLERAEEYLVQDCAVAAKIINTCVVAPLTQNQFDALVSFVYNTGRVGPTMLKRLNSNDYLGAAGEFGKWIYAKGPDGKSFKLPALAARRAAERELFERK